MATPILTNIGLPINLWDKNSIRPGPVGSVGDVLTSTRIKQSSPDMPFAYDKKFGPGTDVLRGSNVQDGQWYSFSNHGYGPQTKKRKLGTAANIGWVSQDILPEDRTTEPILLDQPMQGWKSQVAEILERQGDMFTNLPGGYQLSPTEIPRGGAYPTVQNNRVTLMPSNSRIIDTVVSKASEAQTTPLRMPFSLQRELSQ